MIICTSANTNLESLLFVSHFSFKFSCCHLFFFEVLLWTFLASAVIHCMRDVCSFPVFMYVQSKYLQVPVDHPQYLGRWVAALSRHLHLIFHNLAVVASVLAMVLTVNVHLRKVSRNHMLHATMRCCCCTSVGLREEDSTFMKNERAEISR